MKPTSESNNFQAFILSSILSILANIFYWIYIIPHAGKTNNIQLYIISVIIYCISFFVFFILCKNVKFNIGLKRGAVSFLPFWGILGASAIYLSVMFMNDMQLFASDSARFVWHNISFGLLVCILLLLYFGFIRFTNNFNGFSLENTKADSVGYWALSVVMALIAGYSLYYPNVLVIDFFHFHAYYNSVYNVLYDTPYTAFTNSIYGHYAILIVPVLRVLQSMHIETIKGFALIMSGIGVLTYLLQAYALKVFVKNKTLRMIGIIAMGLIVISLRAGTYLQLQPHRSIIVAVTMAMIAFYVSHRKHFKIISAVGYAVSCLLVVWNTETGLCAAAAWSVFMVYELINAHKTKIFRTVLFILLQIVLLIAAFFGAFLITDLYNISVGGPAETLTNFLFPLLTGTNTYLSMLETPFQTFISPWLAFIVILFIFLGKGFHSLKLFNKSAIDTEYSGGLFAIAVMGILSLIYYINRTAYYNIEIIYPLIILLLCVISQYCLKPVKELFENKSIRKITFSNAAGAGFGLVSIFVVFALAVGLAVNMVPTFEIKKEARVYATMDNFVQPIKKELPADTVGLGFSVPEVYSVMNRDTKIHILDFSDIDIDPTLFPYVADVLYSLGKTKVFTTGNSLEVLRRIVPEACQYFLDMHVEAYRWAYSSYDTFVYFAPKQ